MRAGAPLQWRVTAHWCGRGSRFRRAPLAPLPSPRASASAVPHALQCGAQSMPPHPLDQSRRIRESGAHRTDRSRASSPCDRDCWRRPRVPHPRSTAWSGSSARARSPPPSASHVQNLGCCECLHRATNRWTDRHRPPHRDFRALQPARESRRTGCGSYPDTHPRAGTPTWCDTARRPPVPPEVGGALR